MLKFTCRGNFKEIRSYIQQAKQKVRGKMEEIGEEAVEYARENGNYRNRTGRLRRSTRYEASVNQLRIINSAPYAADVEARGYDVISGAALYAEQRLKDEFER